MSALDRGEPSLPPGLASRLNPVCDRFEEQWLAGATPRVEEFLTQADEADRPALVRELLQLERHYRSQRGEHPAPEEYRPRLPQYGDLLDTAFAPHPESQGEPATISVGSSQTTTSGTGPIAGSLPGYQILGVLGRGGMGVVYKARQVKLNRVVALKMILAGEHAGTQAIARFLAEARAIAKLSHPNIVQVYEIGEHEGLPYIAMEFVAGGALTDHWKKAPSAHDVARLVETLAGAIDEAHRQGIIHRDLKPANILLTDDGSPKIGDFGLAKQLGEEQQTASGAVMGTPSFMAPEQALGQSRHVGPATDVYALGAILYAGLTGRAPFIGETNIDILRKVAEHEPTSLTRLVPGLPRDLETICLKCLQKSPADRYARARSLADDLRRFREGEPILARPAGWGERVWKWVRRRPTRAALIALSLLVPVLVLTIVLLGRTSEEAQRLADQQKQIIEINDRFVAGLEAKPSDWSVMHLHRLEDWEAELVRLAPDQDPGPRQRKLDQALGETIKAHPPTASRWEEESPPVPELMRVLERRNAELFSTVAKRWKELRLVLDLTPPFKSVEAFFPLAKFERGDFLVFNPGETKAPLIYSNVPCTRYLEMEAVLQHPTWNIEGPVGLAIDAAQQGTLQRGYSFLVELAQTPQDADQPKIVTFADALKRRGSITLSIYRSTFRSKQRLLQRHMPIAQLLPTLAEPDKQPAGAPTVRLRVKRIGDRLIFRCNDMELEFEDALPQTGKQAGVFACYLPPDLRVAAMQAFVKNAEVDPGELDEADNLYAQEQFAEALLKYQAQIQNSAKALIQVEAKYKKALCLLGLKDFEKAAEALTSLIVDPEAANERWHPLAMCQLWALRLKQGKEAEAEAVFRNLPRDDLDKLLAFVPDHICEEILGHYRWRMTGLGTIAPQHRGVKGREMALEIEQLFHSSRASVLRARFLLFQAYFLDGQTKKAQGQATVLHKEAWLPDPSTWDWWFDFWEESSLMLRREKQPERALADLDQVLFDRTGHPRGECLPLLVERASLHFLMGKEKQAVQDLDDFFRFAKSDDFPFRFWTRACLIRGLLLQKRDPQAAREAWRLGLPRKDGTIAWAVRDRNLPALFHQIALAHLCEELTDAEVERLTDIFFHHIGGMVENQGFKELVRSMMPEFNPETMGLVLRTALKTPEGRQLLHQLAFHELSHSEFFREAVPLGFLHLSKRMLAPHQLSKEEDVLLQKIGADLYNGILSGKISRKQLAQGGSLVFIWRGDPLAIYGWKFGAGAFEPGLRGNIAYLFALRYLHVFRKPGEAAAFFQHAVDLAPNGSQLRVLATNELQRLKMK